MSTPGRTSPTPTVRTFVLEEQTGLNLEPRIAGPGDIVICDGMGLRVPEPGTHRGESGKVGEYGHEWLCIHGVPDRRRLGARVPRQPWA
jgi:hypothetical protein